MLIYAINQEINTDQVPLPSKCRGAMCEAVSHTTVMPDVPVSVFKTAKDLLVLERLFGSVEECEPSPAHCTLLHRSRV